MAPTAGLLAARCQLLSPCSACGRRYQRHREVVLRGALAAFVVLTAWGARWEASAAAAPVPWLQYSLLQGAVMAATSLAATVSFACLLLTAGGRVVY